MSGRGHRNAPFWQKKPLHEMSAEEWESLCDGCGQCCLIKLEDEDTGDIAVTRLACKLLDLGSCQCSDYGNRQDHVPDCVKLTPSAIGRLAWLPETCAYRLLDEGEDLRWWHPLISGTKETVFEAGVSIRGSAISEKKIPEDRFPAHIVGWIEKKRS
ncbi:MAG: YcgN family cysteine cluster protein [Rhodomicrobium sp.]